MVQLTLPPTSGRIKLVQIHQWDKSYVYSNYLCKVRHPEETKPEKNKIHKDPIKSLEVF